MGGNNRGGNGAGRFGAVTFVDHMRPDGLVVRWESRHHRKHLSAAAVGSTRWAPRARGWWIAVLFAVGSVLFALGALPGYVSAVGARWDSVTYFIGSLFFTSAAFLTYREAVDAAPRAEPPPPALLRLPAAAHRLVGNARCSSRHPLLQRQHRRRHGRPT